MQIFLTILSTCCFISAIYFFFGKAVTGTPEQLLRDGTYITLFGLGIVFLGIKFLVKHSETIEKLGSV